MELILDNDNFQIFERKTFEYNYQLIKKWHCKWCSDSTDSWVQLKVKGRLYGVVDVKKEILYSVFILNNGTIRRIIDNNHNNINNRELNAMIKSYIL